MVFTAYNCEQIYMKRMMVAGGGMGNGNAYAVVEILYKDEQMEEVDSVWYKEFGDNPISKRIGNEVEWGEYDTFKILEDGEYVEDEDKEEEEEEDSDFEDDDDWKYLCPNLHWGGQYGCDLCDNVKDIDNQEMLKEWLNKNNKYCYKLHKKWLEDKKEEEEEEEEPLCQKCKRWDCGAGAGGGLCVYSTHEEIKKWEEEDKGVKNKH